MAPLRGIAIIADAVAAFRKRGQHIVYVRAGSPLQLSLIVRAGRQNPPTWFGVMGRDAALGRSLTLVFVAQRHQIRRMPELLRSASSPVLALYVFGFFSSLTLLALAVGFAAERALGRTRKIFAVPLAKGQLAFELIGNLVFLAVSVVCVTVALSLHLVRLGSPSFAREVSTFVALFVAFPVFYWVLHRAMHTRPLLFVHRWHHRSHVTTPLSGQSVSVGEALLWMLGYVGLPMLFSLVVPIGLEGWVAYLAFNVFGNIVGHSNVELTARPFASRTAALLANPFVYHALHHARWRVNYGFQAAGMDRLFGTESDDWELAYERVIAGRPLTRFGENLARSEGAHLDERRDH